MGGEGGTKTKGPILLLIVVICVVVLVDNPMHCCVLTGSHGDSDISVECLDRNFRVHSVGFCSVWNNFTGVVRSSRHFSLGLLSLVSSSLSFDARLLWRSPVMDVESDSMNCSIIVFISVRKSSRSC